MQLKDVFDRPAEWTCKITLLLTVADLFTSSEGIIKVVQAFETSVTVANSVQYSLNCIHMVFLKVIM